MATSPTLAAFLSLTAPGLGQCYTGETAKGLSLLAVSAGIAIASWLSKSLATQLLMSLVYVALAIPAAMDAHAVAQGRPSTIADGAPWRLVLMLLVVGPFALPLLWQSRRFSRGAKIGWTVAVTLIAILSIVVLAALGPMVERALGGLSQIE